MSMMTEKYPAVVVSSDDPEQRGRIRVSCTGLLGDDDAELPQWVEPKAPWGWFLIPDPGEQVEIEVVTHNDEDESYGQSSIDGMDPQWTGVRYLGGEEAQTPAPLHDFFKENYGKRRGFATPFGHVLVFDDTDGKSSIAIHYATAKAAGTDAEKLHSIVLDKDGIKQTIAKKHSFHFKPDGSVEATIDEGAGFKVNGKDADAVMTVGDGAKHAAIVEALEAFYTNTVKPFIENILVNTSMGPSATVIASVGPAPDWDPAINSSKLAFPDG